MMKYAIVLILAAAGLIQLSYACPKVTAPDGSTYDLSPISNRVHQYTLESDGASFTFNISICAPLPEPCAGNCYSANSAGVCMFWGPSSANAKCMGRYTSSQIIGLNNGLGVQIVYGQGDSCGSCIPSGPRSSIITLICLNDGAHPNKLTWTDALPDQPSYPNVDFFYGTFNCGPIKHVKEIATKF